MKCEICKQPILEEGYKYVHPICPKREDVMDNQVATQFKANCFVDIRDTAKELGLFKASQSAANEDLYVAILQMLYELKELRRGYSNPPKPELTPEEKEWFEGLEYVRPDDPFPFFRFCPCGSISQHLPIAREQVTPIQWIREHYEHRNIRTKSDKEADDYWAVAILGLASEKTWLHMRLNELERAIGELRKQEPESEQLYCWREEYHRYESRYKELQREGEPVPPELTQEQKEWFGGLLKVNTLGTPDGWQKQCNCGVWSMFYTSNTGIPMLPIEWIHKHFPHRNIAYPPLPPPVASWDRNLNLPPIEPVKEKLYGFSSKGALPVQDGAPVLSALFFVTDGAVFMRVERDPQDLLLKSPYRWMLHEGGAKVLQARPFEEYQSDIAQWVESLGGEKPSVYKQRVPGENKWDVTIKDDEFTLDDRTMKAIEGWHGSKIYVYEPAAYKAEWTDLTHVYCAYASCGVVESQPKDYSVFRLEVKKV